MKDPDECEYLHSLAMCHRVSREPHVLLISHGLEPQERNALNGVFRIIEAKEVPFSAEYTDFVNSYSDEEIVYPYWEYS
jgi:hypothetical protein